jgi:sugar lactone lactonase YvrE
MLLGFLALTVIGGCGQSGKHATAGPEPGGQATRVVLSAPEALAVDSSGNLYVSEFAGARVVKISPDGRLAVVAGTGKQGYSGDGGRAVYARLTEPTGLALDSHGNLAIADYGSDVVREVDSSGRIRTVVGRTERLVHPIGVAFHRGELYVADSGTSSVVKRQRSGSLESIASFVHPTYLLPHGQTLYMSSAVDNRISQINLSEGEDKGVISAVAGTGTEGFGGDNGPATDAKLSSPYGLALDSGGNLFVSDRENNRVRKITPDGIITTVAGTGVAGFGGDGGPATAAKLNSPVGLAIDQAGDLYIADGDNGRIRRVDPAGLISTVAGKGQPHRVEVRTGRRGPRPGATLARLEGAEGLALDSRGNLYVSEFASARVVRISPAGRLKVVAGTGRQGYSGDGLSAIAAQLSEPTGLAVDTRGTLTIADYNADTIRRVNTRGVIMTLTGSASARLHHPIGIALHGSELYVADTGNQRIVRISPSGGTSVVAKYVRPSYLVLDRAGNLYFSDLVTNAVRVIDPSGHFTTLAGSGKRGFGGDGGAATKARLDTPYGLALDGDGNVYVVDRQNNRVRKIAPNGVITTVAGTGLAGFSGDGGPATAAKLNSPVGLAIDAAGDLYIADGGNGRVRRVDPAGVITTVAGGVKSSLSQ